MRHHSAVPPDDIRPMRSLGLLSVAHAINHAQAVLLPLIYLAIIDEWGVGVQTIAFLAAFGAFASGMVQLSYAGLTRVVSRRRLLGIGGILFGGGFALRRSRPASRRSRSPTSCRASGLAAAPGRQRPPGRAVPGRATRVRDQRPYRRRQRRHGRGRARRRAAHRRRRLARRVHRVRDPGDRRRARDPAPRARARDGSCRGPGERHGPRRVRADPARPGPALAVPDIGPRRRRPRPRRRQPVRAAVPDPRDRARPGDGRPDVRRAHRVLGADAARRRLAVRPDRTQAADRRRVPRRCARVHRLPAGRLVDRLAVGRDRGHGPVLVRREPAAPGAARRHLAAIRPATRRMPCTSRSRSGSGRCGSPCTASSSTRPATPRACRSCSS